MLLNKKYLIGMLVLFMSSLLPSLGNAKGAPVALVGATIIDGTGAKPLSRGVILIDGGRIVDIGPEYRVAVPEFAEKINLRGKFIIPGLIDANLHLINISRESLVRYEGRYEDIILEAAQITLKTGQTTVFDTWGPREPLTNIRDGIESGEHFGSRVFIAGNIIGLDGPLSSDFDGKGHEFVTKAFAKRINALWQENVGQDLAWLTPEQVRQEVRKYISTGVDFLKYASAGHGRIKHQIVFSPRVQKTIVDEAHAAGLTVQAHPYSVESLDIAIDAGVDIVTHCDITGTDNPAVLIPDTTIKKMLDRQTFCSVRPFTQAHLDEVLSKLPVGKSTHRKVLERENLRRLIKAGVPLLMSTDGSVPSPKWREFGVADAIDPRDVLGEGHFNGLVGLEELGMAPQEILKSATSNIAKAYRKEADIGTLEVGKFADLLILDRNPLENAQHYRSIHQVMKEGKIIQRKLLPEKSLFSIE